MISFFLLNHSHFIATLIFQSERNQSNTLGEYDESTGMYDGLIGSMQQNVIIFDDMNMNAKKNLDMNLMSTYPSFHWLYYFSIITIFSPSSLYLVFVLSSPRKTHHKEVEEGNCVCLQT